MSYDNQKERGRGYRPSYDNDNPSTSSGEFE